MKAYDVAVDQQLSGAEICTDVVSNVQLGGVQLHVVLIMLRTGRDWNRIANASQNWSTEAWRFFFQTYHPKSDARLLVLMMVVLAVLLDTNDVVAEASDAMDVDVTSSRSFWKTGTQSSCAGITRSDSEHSNVTSAPRSREASMFEASKRSLAETRCVDMVNVDLNALEIGAVLLLARNHKIQVAIDSCAAVTVFVHFRWFVTKSCKSCMDLSARKVKDKLRDVSFWHANPRMAETCEVLGAVSESDMSHDVLFPCHDEGTQACVPRGMRNETGAGVKRSLRIASRDCSSRCSDDWKERQFRFELITFGAGTDRGHDDQDCKFIAPEMRGVWRVAIPALFLQDVARLRSLVVGGNPGSRAVVFPIPRVGLLEERPAVSGRREKTQREELQCPVEDDTAEGLVVKTVKILLVTSLGRCDDRSTAGLCTLRVTMLIDGWKAHVPMFKWKGIRNSIWIVLTCEEQPKIESRGCADSRRVNG